MTRKGNLWQLLGNNDVGRSGENERKL